MCLKVDPSLLHREKKYKKVTDCCFATERTEKFEVLYSTRLGSWYGVPSVLPCSSTLAKQVWEHKLANARPNELQVAKLPQWKKPIMTDLANLILRALLKEHKCL